jgi:hypothetical protein
MDSLITAAARALAVGDPLGALKRIALRDDPPALALRGIAMAQLGDHVKAKALLRRAARAFGPSEVMARARCAIAEAEVALASRHLAWPEKELRAARVTLEAHGDWLNVAHARHLEIRRLLLTGHLVEAEETLSEISPVPLPPASRAVYELLAAEIAMRRVRADAARSALSRAKRAARRAGIPGLLAEVDNALRVFHSPAACLLDCGAQRPLLLADVEALLTSRALIVDARRHLVFQRGTSVSLAKRPVLFALARALGEAWPAEVARDALIARVFRTRCADESHRARLRVEVGRLRRLLVPLAGVTATKRGFMLMPRRAKDVHVLARPIEDQHATLLAVLTDGEPWSSSALALALHASQRTVQRALDSLNAAGKVQSFGRGRARRWTVSPLQGLATGLLLHTSSLID